MKAFIVVPEPAPHIQQTFEEAGRESKKKHGFVKSMEKLPEDILQKFKEHAKYITDLKNAGKLLFAGVSDDFIDAIIVYAAENLEEAKGLADGDPFIKSGLFISYKIKPLIHWV